MPTRAQIATNVTSNLEEAQAVFYTADDVKTAIQDAYNTYCALTGCLVKAANIPNISATHWEIKKWYPDFLYLVGLWNWQTNRWLDGVPRQLLDGLRWDWELWEGQPFYFSPIGFRRITVVPHLPTTSGTLLMLYKASAPLLSDSSVPVIPNQIENILEWYATASLLEEAKEFQKAQIYWKMWKEGLNIAKGTVHNLANYDKQRICEPYFQLPRFGPASSPLTVKYVDKETPYGTMDGTNRTFALMASPVNGSVVLTLDGATVSSSNYSVTGSTLTYAVGQAPAHSSIHTIYYEVA